MECFLSWFVPVVSVEQGGQHQFLKNSHSKAAGHGFLNRWTRQSVPSISGSRVADPVRDLR